MFQHGFEALKTLRNDLLRAISIARSTGEIRDIDPLQTIVNILSLVIFFFLGKPLVGMISQNVDIDDFEAKRIDNIMDILCKWFAKTNIIKK